MCLSILQKTINIELKSKDNIYTFYDNFGLDVIKYRNRVINECVTEFALKNYSNTHLLTNIRNI